MAFCQFIPTFGLLLSLLLAACGRGDASPVFNYYEFAISGAYIYVFTHNVPTIKNVILAN